MTPLPKHLEEMRDELYTKHSASRINEPIDRNEILHFEAGFNQAASLMLKDLESMAKALEQYEDVPLYKVAGISSAGPIDEEYYDEEFTARETLKTYREKYGVKDE